MILLVLDGGHVRSADLELLSKSSGSCFKPKFRLALKGELGSAYSLLQISYLEFFHDRVSI